MSDELKERRFLHIERGTARDLHSVGLHSYAERVTALSRLPFGLERVQRQLLLLEELFPEFRDRYAAEQKAKEG